MIITCENCSTRFTLDDALVKPEGSRVRCSRCRHIFTAMPPAPEPETVQETDSLDDSAFSEDEFTVDFPEDDAFEQDQPVEEDASFAFEDESPETGTTDFDPGDFQGELDFDEADLDFEMPGEPDAPDTDGQAQEIEFDAPALVLDGTAASDDDADSGSDTGLAMDAADTFEELEFEDLELSGDSTSFEDDGAADIEISFDEDGARQELGQISLEMDHDDSDDVDFETQDISFETGDDETAGGLPVDGLEMEAAGDDTAETGQESDLDLSFDGELEMDEIQFDDPDEAGGPEDGQAFPEIEDFQPSPEDEDVDLSLTDSDDALTLGDRKFAEYDQVLEQETEPDNFPELDEELNEPAVSEPEKDEDDTPAIPDPDETEADLLGSPLITPDPDAPMASARRRRKQRSGFSIPLLILFLLFIVVMAGHLISIRLGIPIPYMDKLNIPYVTQAFKPAPPPVMAIGPVPNDASTEGRFVTNATAGRLFIVTGKVDNPDAVAYSHIRIKGTLLTKDNKKAASQVIYCGNEISEEILKSGSIADIEQLLSLKEGVQNTNINIRPGTSVRFMLVFSNLPENLANFTVEVLDYQPAGAQ